MSKRKTKAQLFRDSATEEQWLEAVKDHDLLSDRDYKEKHGFSWSSILAAAAEKGYYQRKREYGPHTVSTCDSISHTTAYFTIPDQTEELEKVARSLQLDKGIYERLKRLESDKRQYTHSAILNHLLEVALKQFDY